MSELQEEASVQTGGREVLVRTFAVAQQELDGRTLHVRIVPFDEVATVADPPDYTPYKERFAPGVFSAQENAAHRIRLRTDHAALDNGSRKPGLSGVVGKGVSLRETSAGVEGEFRFLTTPEADTALELTREGGYDGVSAEFIGIKSKMIDGVKTRTKAHLDSVALALGPAYSKAEILALREGSDSEIVEGPPVVPPLDHELLERMSDLGIEIPPSMAEILARAYTEAPWDGAASRWDTPEAYCAASAIDLNPAGGPKTKDRCHLPYKEPGSGTVNVNGVRAALSRIGQGYPQDATQAQRDAARSRLEKLLNSFNSSQS